jgi:hypothetical protein
MPRTEIAVATAVNDTQPISASAPRWRRIALTFLVSGVLGGQPAPGNTAGLDCPEAGPGAVPNLIADVQVKPRFCAAQPRRHVHRPRAGKFLGEQAGVLLDDLGRSFQRRALVNC